ncbi:superoxide dismutase [Candidatus Woesearchaeota archaeon]|nr:superoxide dismutase [Candidatus Woesearchaeota archaeon]
MAEAKPLEYKKLEFLSEKQLVEHYTLYNGYVNKLNEARSNLPNIDFTKANQTFSELRSIKRAETFALNGIKLHESYFENISEAKKPEGKILRMIEHGFNSYEDFKKEFMATALAVRGWVVLAYDLDECGLRIIGSDAHDNGAVWNCVALIILDVYEHAYFLDYGTARKAYVEKFMDNLNWDAANKILEKFTLK